jgi:hypothetical protein
MMHTCKCGSDDVNVVHGGNNAIMLATQANEPIDWEKVKKEKVRAKCLECYRVTERPV